MSKRISYKRAFEIACDLLIGSNIAGIDADRLFELCMNDPKYEGVVSHYTYMDFIVNNIDRFSNNDEERQKAIERIGF